MAKPHSRRRIAYLVSEYPATSHTFILREVLGLRQRGFDIITASLNPDARPRERLTEEELAERENTYVIKRHGVFGALVALLWALGRHPGGLVRGLATALKRAIAYPRQASRPLFHWVEALMVGRWMARQGADHLHVHFATAGASVASLARRMFPITLSMMVHGPDEFSRVNEEHFADKVASADFVLCISHFARSQTQYHSDPDDWDKLEIVRLGVNTDHFRPSPTAPSGPFRLLCVGRLTPAKGQALLLDAVAELHRAGQPIRLELVGDGPDRAALEARCRRLGLESATRFHGALNHDQVHALYAQCQALALPSFAEGIPVVLMEAMACGLPCLTTRITGIPELIDHDQNGLLVPASSTRSLVEQLQRLLQEPGLARRLGQAARQRVVEDYNLETNLDRLADCLTARLEGLS